MFEFRSRFGFKKSKHIIIVTKKNKKPGKQFISVRLSLLVAYLRNQEYDQDIGGERMVTLHLFNRRGFEPNLSPPKNKHQLNGMWIKSCLYDYVNFFGRKTCCSC